MQPTKKEYTLYKVTPGGKRNVAEEIDRLPLIDKNSIPRIVFFGGTHDQNQFDINANSQTALLRAIGASITSPTGRIGNDDYQRIPAADFYTIAPAKDQSWGKDNWVPVFAGSEERSPAAVQMAEDILSLPVSFSGREHVQRFMKLSLERAEKTILIGYSIGSTSIKHMRDHIFERLNKEMFPVPFISEFLGKIRAINLAPPHVVGQAHEDYDFSQVTFISSKDTTAGEATYGPEIYERIKQIEEQDSEGLQRAFEAHVAEVEEAGGVCRNKNLHRCDLTDSLGTIRVNKRNLVIYGCPIDTKSRTIYTSRNGAVRAKEVTENHPLAPHSLSLYLNLYECSYKTQDDKMSTIVASRQRFAGAPLIGEAFRDAINGKNGQELIAEITKAAEFHKGDHMARLAERYENPVDFELGG